MHMHRGVRRNNREGRVACTATETIALTMISGEDGAASLACGVCVVWW